MTHLVVARRYANALFDLGKTAGDKELENNGSSLGAMQEALESCPQLVNVFTSPMFTVAEKKGILAKLTLLLKCTPTTTNFLMLLAERNRFDCLPGIIETYQELLDQEKGLVRGKLFTAVALDEAKQKAIVTQLEQQTKRKLLLEFGVSPEILGGVVLKVGDNVLDASIKAQLSILKDSIKRGEQSHAY